MELSCTDEQAMLRESVRATIGREAPLRKVRDWVLDAEPADCRSAFELAARQGWTGIGVPEDAGGQGGGVLELAILAEELGRGATPADGLYGGLLCARALLACDGHGARAVVARLATGSVIGALVRPADRPLDDEISDGAVPLVTGAPLAALLPRGVGSTLHLHTRDRRRLNVNRR